jgi:hypothetical protein
MNPEIWKNARRYEWIQSKSPSEEFVLSADGKKMAGFKFTNWTRTAMIGESAWGKWTYSTRGFWKPDYVIYNAETGVEEAVYTPRWHTTEGTLQLAGGERFQWNLTGLFSGVSVLTDDAGREILRIHPGRKTSRWRDMFKTEGTVDVMTRRNDPRFLSMLVLFCWYLLLLRQEEASAAATVGSMG